MTIKLLKDFPKVCHQQGAQCYHPDQHNGLVFRENNNYHQIGDVYFEFDITVPKNDGTNFLYDDPIRLGNNPIAFCFEEARLSTTVGSDFEHNKFYGQVSTIMKVISNKDCLLSEFDEINENDFSILERLADLPAKIKLTIQQKMLINKHIEANKTKMKGYLYLEDIFGFYRSFEKATKNLGLHLAMKTNDLQDIIHTSVADDIIVTIKNLYLFVPNLIPSVET